MLWLSCHIIPGDPGSQIPYQEFLPVNCLLSDWNFIFPRSSWVAWSATQRAFWECDSPAWRSLCPLVPTHSAGFAKVISLLHTCSYSSYTHGQDVAVSCDIAVSSALLNVPVCSIGRAFRDNFCLFPWPLPPRYDFTGERKCLDWPVVPFRLV